MFDKTDPSGVHINPEGEKQTVSYIKNSVSIDRLCDYKTASLKRGFKVQLFRNDQLRNSYQKDKTLL